VKLNSLDLNKVAVFCQIMDSGGYARASEVLNVTPSALSQTVSNLEAALGFALFDRIGKKLVPTEKARKLHRGFRVHQSGFLHSLQEITAGDREVSGLLRVGAYLEFAKSQLSAPIAAFTQAYPQAQLKMVFDTPTRLQRQLQQGQLDLCFSIFQAPKQDKQLRSENVYEEELVLISSNRFLSDSPSYDEVMAAPMIEYYFNHQPIKRWLATHYAKRPKKIPVRVYAATAEMVVSLVREGAGIGVVPLYLLRAGTVSGVRVIRPTSRRLTDHIWMLERTGATETALRQAFKERLLTRLRGREN
jgi:DNA-binding transcriptional LysR family regulator